jgi:hypothetical protein
VHRAAQLRSQLDVLSRPGRLVGAGYLVWLDGATSVIVARDVVCLENKIAIGPQVESVDRPDTFRETALPMPCPGLERVQEMEESEVEESADEVPIPRRAPVRSCLVGGSAAVVLCPVAPDNLRAAMASPEAKEWKAAMDEEI